jgi:hypothetical protein
MDIILMEIFAGNVNKERNMCVYEIKDIFFKNVIKKKNRAGEGKAKTPRRILQAGNGFEENVR